MIYLVVDDCSLYRLNVGAGDMSQFAYCAVFDKSVGQSYTAHCRGLAIVAQPFEHSRTESTCKLSVLNGNDTAEALRNAATSLPSLT